ncbi:MAG TPA: hypothetical protein VK795_06050 [Terriglobales bacterium]|jgi:hypothetical protein|nr:hypothetical protein [Terriglobales bacterium]
MELFLNLLWVLIATGVIAVWRNCWLPEAQVSRREPFREWTAMGCALVLLFFAVSLTDDLHSNVSLLEDCSSSRRHSMCGHHSDQSNRTVREIGPAALPRIVEIDSPQFAAMVSCFVSAPSSEFLFEFTTGRAPPIAVL